MSQAHKNSSCRSVIMILKHSPILAFAFALALVVISLANVRAFPHAYKADSPIKMIMVPYQRNVISGHPYEFPKALGRPRKVLLPTVNMDEVPNFNLNKHLAINSNGGAGDSAAASITKPMILPMDGENIGKIVHFADGAYPVYYMPGKANGKFNGKISLLS